MSDTDIAEYYSKTPSSEKAKSRRGKSVPLSKKVREPAAPPAVATGEYNGCPVVVYGEIHNMIDNTFYENLDLKNKTIFVEHATVLCKITKEEKLRLFNVLRGSDWVWYKYVSRNRPVVCIDNRIELGLPTSIEERYVMNTRDDMPAVADCVMRFLRVLATPATKEVFVRAQLTPIYTRSMLVVKEQFGKLLKAGVLNTDELLDTKWKLIQNLVKLAGMLVDINIVKQVKEHADKKKPIVIFAGAAHAYRLHTFFPEVFSALKVEAWMPEDAFELMQTMVFE